MLLTLNLAGCVRPRRRGARVDVPEVATAPDAAAAADEDEDEDELAAAH